MELNLNDRNKTERIFSNNIYEVDQIDRDTMDLEKNSGIQKI